MAHGTGTKRAFTLIEVLITISITLIILLISVSGLRLFSKRTTHLSATRIVLGALEEAHAQTLASYNDTAYGVHIDTGSVTIFEGATYDASATTNDVRTLPARTSVLSTSLSGGVSDITFERLTGNASTEGTVTVGVTTDATISQTITIHSSGLTEIST